MLPIYTPRNRKPKYKQVTTNMNGPVKYLNVLHHNKTQSSCNNFSENIAKILPTSYFWRFEHV